MEVYYYCSYTGSPVGFQLGKLDCGTLLQNTCTLSKNGLLPLIRHCFDQGLVRRAYGHIPETEQHFILVKGLTVKGVAGDEATEYYINFALLADKAEWEHIYQGKAIDAQTIAETFRDSMRLDKESEFGYTVLADCVRKLTSFSPLNLLDGSSWDTEGICMELLSAKADVESLTKALGLDTENYKEYGFKKLPKDNWFQFSKKKSLRMSPKKIILILAAIVAILILLLKLLTGLGKS